MMDEHHEELASLYALDLLAGEERAQFEAALARSPELQALVADLRESAASLAHVAPAATPPAALRERVLGATRQPPASESRGNVVRVPASVFRTFMPWAIAAAFVVLGASLAYLYVGSRTESRLFEQQQRLADVALQSARNQLEAERLLGQRQLASLNQQLAESQQQVTDAARAALDSGRKAADVQHALDAANQRLATTEHDLATVRDQLSTVTERTRHEADLASLKIATLTSMLNNSPQALAVAVWSPEQQQGVLTVDRLPAPPPGQSYELWVIDARPGAKPVSAGVFMSSETGSSRITFRPTAPIATAAIFAVSREKTDGATAHAAPTEVVMISK
jgi:anti-sigma-K factor RskA